MYTGQFEIKAAAVARALLAPPYSVRVGDRVAISMRNYPEWPMAYVVRRCMAAWSPSRRAPLPDLKVHCPPMSCMG